MRTPAVLLFSFEAPDFGDDAFLEVEGLDFACVAIEDFAVFVDEEGVRHGSIPFSVEGFGEVFSVALEEVVVRSAAVFFEESLSAGGGADIMLFEEFGDFLRVFSGVEADGDEF